MLFHYFSPGTTSFFFSSLSFFVLLVQTLPVKLQAVTLAAKLLVLSPAHGTLTQLAIYVFSLARYDRNYDVRDRGRMLQQLLVGVVPTVATTDAKDVGGVVLRRAQVRIVLFEGKAIASLSPSHAAAAHEHDAARRGHDNDLGTLGLVLGRDVLHARLLPDWLEHGVESSLRYVPEATLPSTSTAAVTAIGHVAPSTSRAGTGLGSGGHSTPIVILTPAGSSGVPSPAGSVPNKAGWTDVDAFYASESEEEQEEESEEEEEESEEGEEDEEDEDGDEDEEEERGKSGVESSRQSGKEEHDVRELGLRVSDEEDSTGSDVEGDSSQIVPVSVR